MEIKFDTLLQAKKYSKKVLQEYGYEPEIITLKKDNIVKKFMVRTK